MKKGLLSILAASAVLVGCQNYDDQFDALNTQITALQSEVAGLAGVQSQVNELKNLINSLSTATANQDGELASLNSALQELAGDVADVDAALENVASPEDLQAVEDTVNGLDGDIDELLQLSSVFTGDLTITTQGQLDAALEYGNKVRIVNGNVIITVTTDMTQADVQTVVDRINTITGDLTYTSNAASIDETTFESIVGVQNLTVKQSGGVQFPNLGSAINITIDDAYESKVTNIDFGALASVSSFIQKSGTTTTSHHITMTSATNLDLGSLAKYTPAALDIDLKKGATLDIASLEDKDALDAQTDYTLEILGPAAVNITQITDGSITLEDVEDATVNGFSGAFTLNAGVVDFSADKVTSINFSAAADLENLTITGAKKTATSAAPAVAITATHGDLVNVTLSGVTGAVSAASAGNLASVTMSGEHTSLSLTSLGDLVSVNVNGAKIGDVTVTGNSDLEALTLDHTTKLAATDKGATVNISNNSDLATLNFSANSVDNLTVQSNAKLARVDFSELTSIGASGAKATVKVGGVGAMNELTAAKITDKYEAAGAAADANGGSFSSGTSNMSSLKDYLVAAKASPSTTGVKVYFDKADLHVQKNATGTADTETTNVTMSTANQSKLVVMDVSAAVITGSTVRQTNTSVFPTLANGLNAQVQTLGSNEGVTITAGGVTATIIQGTGVTTIDDLVTKINADTTFGSDFTVTAAKDSHKAHIVRINYTSSGGSAATTTAGGNIYYTYGTASGTVAIGTGSDSADIASALASAMSNTDYNASASGSDITVYRTVGTTANHPNSNLSNNAGALPSLSFTIDAAMSSTTAQLSSNASNTAGLNSDFFLGSVASPQVGLRVTVQNNSTSLNRTGTIARTGTSGALGTPVALASTTNMVQDKSQVAAFSDIENPVTVTAAATTDRTGWF